VDFFGVVGNLRQPGSVCPDWPRSSIWLCSRQHSLCRHSHAQSQATSISLSGPATGLNRYFHNHAGSYPPGAVISSVEPRSAPHRFGKFNQPGLGSITMASRFRPESAQAAVWLSYRWGRAAGMLFDNCSIQTLDTTSARQSILALLVWHHRF
jgi:hypothetical protein